MISKYFLLIVLLISFSVIHSQNEDENEKKSKKIHLLVGTEYKITPIHLKHKEISVFETQPTTNIDSQISGVSILYIIKYNFNRGKMNLNFKHSLRNDLLVFDNSYTNNGDLNEPIHTIINDYHFLIGKNFNLKSDFFLNIEVGYSLMNRGTEYRYTKIISDSEINYISDNNFNFNAYTFNVGLSKNKITFSLGANFVEKHQYAQINKEAGFIIPNFQFQYKLLKL